MSKIYFSLKKITLSIFVLFCISCQVQAQTKPVLKWERTYGTSQQDYLFSAEATANGGFILGGHSFGSGGDKTLGNFGSSDAWFIKLDKNGVKEWDTAVGGTGTECIMKVRQTLDGGYIAAGWSASPISGNKTAQKKGDTDAWIVRLDAQGNKIWDKSFNGGTNSGDSRLYSVQLTPDNGFIFSGFSTASAGQDKSENNKGTQNIWLIKTDENGNKIWDKTYGTNSVEDFPTVISTSDGGYMIGCVTQGNLSGDRTEPLRGYGDYWMLKLDENGDKMWDKSFGGNFFDTFSDIKQTTDGGYILGGYTPSKKSGDKSENQKSKNADFWVVKTDASGIKQWDRTLGTNADEKGNYLYSLNLCMDGGYLLAGSSEATAASGDKSEPGNGNEDIWIVKIGANGEKVWDKTLGGSINECANAVVELTNGDIFVAGYSNSPSGGMKSRQVGVHDFWALLLASPQPDENGILYVNKTTNSGVQLGDSWENALTELSEALQIASVNSSVKEIWVAKGTYYPTSTGDRTVSFEVPSGIKLYGGFAGTENAVEERQLKTNPTVLSGDLNNNDDGNYSNMEDNSFHIMKLHHASSETVIDGFTFTSGRSDQFGYTGDFDNKKGPAIYNYASSPTIINCIFTTNYADHDGAGIYNVQNSAPKIYNSLFTNNRASYGGAILNTSGSYSEIVNCTFAYNSVMGADRGVSIYNQNSSGGSLKNSILWDNSDDAHIINENSTFLATDNIIKGGYSTDDEQNRIYIQDPQFNISVEDYYSLKKESPAIGMGDNAALPENMLTDIFGNKRIRGANADLGAQEYLGEKPVFSGFANIDKTYGDDSFTLLAPISNSNGTFTFKNANPAVAFIYEDTFSKSVYITGAGQTIITAVQEETEYFQTDSVSLLLNVAKANATLVLKINGVAYDDENLANAAYGDEKIFSYATNSDANFTDISFDLLDDYLDPYIDFSNLPFVKAIKVGTSYVKVTIPETANYNSVSATIGFKISKATQQITFDALPVKKVGDADFELIATSNFDLPVSFSGNNSAVASVYQDENDGYKWKVKIKNKGQIVINAYNEGDENYSGASYEQLLIVEEGTLPVVLSSYVLKTESNSVELKWTTESEQNNKYFVVYRSGDGKQFKELGVVDAIRSAQTKTYSFRDNNPITGMNYYLLKQIDMDGKENELGIRNINFSSSLSQLTMYPNPTVDYVNINMEAGKYHQCIVSDIYGKILQQINIDPNQLSFSVHLENYATGMYILKLIGKEGFSVNKVFKIK